MIWEHFQSVYELGTKNPKTAWSWSLNEAFVGSRDEKTKEKLFNIIYRINVLYIIYVM